MAYRATYINRLEQFDAIEYSLLLVDDEGIMPEVRIEKRFTHSHFPSLSQGILNMEAQKDIDLYTQKFLDEQEG